MNVQRIAGTTAVIAAAGMLVVAIVSSIAGLVAGAQTWTSSGVPVTGLGPGMMGGGFGPGMMGGGHMSPGMMGPGHMGWYGGSSGTTNATVPGAPTVTLTATEFAFSPAEITLPSGDVNLSLVNKGVVPHDLTIPALGVRVVAAAGQTTTDGLRNLPAGTYAGYCSVPGHADAGMRLSVTVR